MEKFDFSGNNSQQEKPAKRQRLGGGPCEVYGCPWEGQIFTNNWNCRYHHGKSGSALGRITLALRNHPQDFHWYEFVISRTPVDFLVGDVEKRAPEHLAVMTGENFSDYKKRMKNHIDSLCEVKSRLLEVAP